MKPGTGIKYLLSDPPYKSLSSKLQLLRIEFGPQFTVADFGYQATRHYISGGWIRISKDTFIRVKKTGEKFTLLRAENIPIAPEQHNFQSSKDWLFFQLFFPAIPFRNCKLDIIENEPEETTDFNFYDIEIQIRRGIELA